MTLEQALKDWQDELEDARREAWRLEEAQRQHEAQQRPLSQRIKLDA